MCSWEKVKTQSCFLLQWFKHFFKSSWDYTFASTQRSDFHYKTFKSEGRENGSLLKEKEKQRERTSIRGLWAEHFAVSYIYDFIKSHTSPVK
jgi:hypothetical protein